MRFRINMTNNKISCCNEEDLWGTQSHCKFWWCKCLRPCCQRQNIEEHQDWLYGIDSYTLHKRIRKKFLTNRVIVCSINQLWYTDLADLNSLEKFNQGYRYLLTCVDILPKHVWTIPLKQTRSEDIVKAFQSIFVSRKPKLLQNEAGREYRNREMILKQIGVWFFTSFNSVGSGTIHSNFENENVEIFHA